MGLCDSYGGMRSCWGFERTFSLLRWDEPAADGSVVPPSSSFCLSCFAEPPENRLAQRGAPVQQELRETPPAWGCAGPFLRKIPPCVSPEPRPRLGEAGFEFLPALTHPCLSLRSLHNKRLYLAVFAAVLGNFSFGFALVYPSPVIPALEAHPSPGLRLDQHTAPWFGVRSWGKDGNRTGSWGRMLGSHRALVWDEELGKGRGQSRRVPGGARLTQPLCTPHSRCSRWERRRAGSARCCSTTAWAAS